jgi:hypothetical protein
MFVKEPGFAVGIVYVVISKHAVGASREDGSAMNDTQVR